MSINITDAAIDKILDLRRKTQMPDGIVRVALRSGGCSGYSYEITMIDNNDEFDKVFEFRDGVKICIDKKSYIFLVGLSLDYEETMMKSGFVFNTPMQRAKCGCGESVAF
jgi:iron-sulfur cluster assembly protein